jgi:dienelactone hydrolase
MRENGKSTAATARNVSIVAGRVRLNGILTVPAGTRGIVLFAHGSGSSRLSPRNQFVAGELNATGIATLLFDLLTDEEESIDIRTAEFRFDIALLAARLVQATDWVHSSEPTKNLKIGYFGSSTGAAAALVAASERRGLVCTVVSRGGRPDLAGPALKRVACPVLFIVGGLDYEVIRINESALAGLDVEKSMRIVPGATHLFEEEGKLEEVSMLACEWLSKHLA